MGAKECYSPVLAVRRSIYLGSCIPTFLLIVYVLDGDDTNFDNGEIRFRDVEGILDILLITVQPRSR